MTVRPHTFRKIVSRCLIAALAVSLCLLIPVYGFAQEQSDQIHKLIEQLKSPDSRVRGSAVYTLSQMGAEAKAAVPALIEALKKDTDPGVRSRAANALSRVGAEPIDAVPALIEAFKNNNEVSNVRSTAANALGQMGADAKDAMPALTEALKDSDSIIHSSIANALAQISRGLYDIKGTEMLSALKASYDVLKDHPDKRVRKQAVEVKRTIDHFESLWWVGLREDLAVGHQSSNHQRNRRRLFVPPHLLVVPVLVAPAVAVAGQRFRQSLRA